MPSSATNTYCLHLELSEKNPNLGLDFYVLVLEQGYSPLPAFGHSLATSSEENKAYTFLKRTCWNQQEMRIEWER